MIEYLGKTITGKGVTISSKKLDAVNKTSPPTNISQLEYFLRLVNYFCLYILKQTTLSELLYALRCKETPFFWSKKCDRSFEALKAELTSPLVLIYYD